jgi:four helix bundle protein
MASFESLKAWQQAHQLVLAVYRLTGKLPRTEEHRLTSQIIRAALSAAANLAEGRERETDKDFAHFVTMSAGSISEVQCCLLVIHDLNYLTDAEIAPVVSLAAGALRLVRALRGSLREPGA